MHEIHDGSGDGGDGDEDVDRRDVFLEFAEPERPHDEHEGVHQSDEQVDYEKRLGLHTQISPGVAVYNSACD